MGFIQITPFYILGVRPWSDRFKPSFMQCRRIILLNMPLPVKQRIANANYQMGQYLISILWCVGYSNLQTPIYEIDALPYGTLGWVRWSVKKPDLSSQLTRFCSRLFQQVPSFLEMMMSISPQKALPLLQDPHTSIRQLSILSVSFERTFRTQSNILVTF